MEGFQQRPRWLSARTPGLMAFILVLVPMFNLFQSSHQVWWQSVPPDLQYLLLSNMSSVGPPATSAEEWTWNPLTSVLQSTNLSHHAVVQLPRQVAQGEMGSGRTRNKRAKVPVVVWPLWELGSKTAASRHMEQNGIEESPFLELSNNVSNFDPNVVWVGDTGYGYGWRVWCSKFQQHVKEAHTRRAQLGLPTSWPIYIVDWTDYDNQQRCTDIERLIGSEFVFYTQRSIVSGRSWNATKGWVDLGRPINLNVPGRPMYRHTPFIVRTDIVQQVYTAVRQRGLQLHDRLEDLPRPVDVTHLWPLNPADARVGGVESQLRTRVSHIVRQLGGTSNGTGTGWNVFVGLAGDAAREGRQGVSEAYIEALLATKIMVVTQRDLWEDHYRLFEALVSGAMVMTDRMLSLPAGLQNGTSLVEFESSEELTSMIKYYLTHPEERRKMARKGRRVAMARHRSWHRLEEIIFGVPLTVCGAEVAANDDVCPYKVHANETWR